MSVWAHMGQRTTAGVGPNLLSWDQDLLVLLWCQASWPSDFQGFSCFCLPSHCRSTEITSVHTIASGFNMGFGNLNPGTQTCRSTLTYGVNPQLSTVFKYKALLLCQVGRCLASSFAQFQELVVILQVSCVCSLSRPISDSSLLIYIFQRNVL